MNKFISTCIAATRRQMPTIHQSSSIVYTARKGETSFDVEWMFSATCSRWCAPSLI